MASVSLRNLTKRFDQSVAVESLSLEIHDTEFVVFLGPSGCGKTTTMRMIAGLEEITSGEVWLGPRLVNDLEPKDRDVAMVFQNYGLYPNLSVYENIRFPLKVRKVPVTEHRERVMRAATMVEMEALLDRRPAQLSGGQRQRVALGRAIVRQPALFLMDEPLSNLDAKLRMSTRAQLKRLHHTLRTTTIYVTHDQIEAMTLADRVVVMNRGVIQQVGTPAEIYNQPRNTFVAGFIGSPAMNLVTGTLSNGTFEAERIRVAGLPRVVDGAVTLGFRAEDATVVEAGGQIEAPVYSVELLGDAAMVSFRLAGVLVSIKAAKEFYADIDQIAQVSLAPQACHLFNIQSGERIAP